MKRNSLLHRFFRNACPPFIRDNRKLCLFLAKRMVNREAMDMLSDFRMKLPHMSEEELRQYYEKLSVLLPQGAEYIDVNSDCLKYILDYANAHPEMHTYLDCACGGGKLTLMLCEIGKKSTGVDFVLTDELKNNSAASFVQSDICSIPFENKSFDVVISAHTLEHIIRIQDAITELRRVTKHTLIIIVPCQREYKYTFETHVHFFPYPESFHRIMENPEGKCFLLGDDILYIEENEYSKLKTGEEQHENTHFRSKKAI